MKKELEEEIKLAMSYSSIESLRKYLASNKLSGFAKSEILSRFNYTYNFGDSPFAFFENLGWTYEGMCDMLSATESTGIMCKYN